MFWNNKIKKDDRLKLREMKEREGIREKKGGRRVRKKGRAKKEGEGRTWCWRGGGQSARG